MDVTDYVKNFPIKPFAKGEVIMTEGDVSDTLQAIQTGYIKVTSVDDAGDERMLWIAGRYDIVPTERLFSPRQPLQFFYTALSDGAAYQINKADFLHAAKNNLGLMSEVATSMSSHYDDLLTRINSAEQASVRGKLIATLRYLAQRFSAESAVDLYQLGLRLTHKDLAEMISSTRETTSVELKKLRTLGCIDYNSSQFIVYVDRCVI